MDDQTLAVYDRGAAGFAQDWNDQPAPTDLHARVLRFFGPGPTADIGCGAGRDTAWLNARGFPTVGYDGSEGLLAEARRRFPNLGFHQAVLPDLAGIADGVFANILCETVIMHLPPAEIGPAVGRLMSLLQPGGTLYLSWRVTQGEDLRDGQGRLYAAFETDLVLRAIGEASVLLDEALVSVSSGKVIHRIIARKAS